MMQKMTAIRVWVMLVAMALVGTVAVRNLAADEGQHDGFFLAAQGGQIAIRTQDGLATKVFPLSGMVRVTRNGHDASLRDFSRGDLVQLLTTTWFGNEQVVAVASVGEE